MFNEPDKFILLARSVQGLAKEKEVLIKASSHSKGKDTRLV